MSTDATVDVAALQRLVAELSRRVEALEAEAAGRAAEARMPTEEVLLAISAAVAAYLGKKAVLKQVRFRAGTTAWAQQGRAAIMASHHDPHRPR